MTTTTDEAARTQLATVAERNGLAPAVAVALVETFIPLAEQAHGLIVEADGIRVTDATQVTEIRQARAARLKLKDCRVEVEKARKELKEESLRRGKAIDAVAGYIRERIEPAEQRLDDAEKFAERAEAQRKARLKADRETLLRPFADPTFYDLGNMPESAWAQLLDSSRIAHEARVAAAAKAEADRAAAEAARIEEEKRVRAENERLRQEAVARDEAARAERERLQAEARARDAAAQAEREAADAALAAERRARFAAEQRERERVAEEKRQAAAAEKERKALERLPDQQKLKALAQNVRHLIALPTVKDAEAQRIVLGVRGRLDELSAWIEQQAEELS